MKLTDESILNMAVSTPRSGSTPIHPSGSCEDQNCATPERKLSAGLWNSRPHSHQSSSASDAESSELVYFANRGRSPLMPMLPDSPPNLPKLALPFRLRPTSQRVAAHLHTRRPRILPERNTIAFIPIEDYSEEDDSWPGAPRVDGCPDRRVGLLAPRPRLRSLPTSRDAKRAKSV